MLEVSDEDEEDVVAAGEVSDVRVAVIVVDMTGTKRGRSGRSNSDADQVLG